MNDMGFLGWADIDGSLRIGVLCRNGSDVLTAPDADPTYTILDKNGATVQTGTLAVNEALIVGRQAASESITLARGYTSGETYGVVVEYAISAEAHGTQGTFAVQ